MSSSSTRSVPSASLRAWGHACTYFSNICQDGSPIRIRLCLPGESGGVMSKGTEPLSEHEDYDWAMVPFEQYMHGLASV